jgi:hypothetical protein
MKTARVNINDWDILFLFSYEPTDLGSVTDALLWAEASDSINQRVRRGVLGGRRVEGFTFSNPSLRRSVSAIRHSDSGPQFLNTAVHEITHIAQDIINSDGIDLYGEELAYLVGDITNEISDIICEMSCPHCRES